MFASIIYNIKLRSGEYQDNITFDKMVTEKKAIQAVEASFGTIDVRLL